MKESLVLCYRFLSKGNLSMNNDYGNVENFDRLSNFALLFIQRNSSFKLHKQPLSETIMDRIKWTSVEKRCMCRNRLHWWFPSKSCILNSVLNFYKWRTKSNFSVSSLSYCAIWQKFSCLCYGKNLPAGTSTIGFADDALVVCAADDVRILELRINESLWRGKRWLNSRGLKMAPKKTEALLARTGDPFSIQGSLSESIRSSGKQALSTWRCSWIVGLALANT